MRSSARFVVLAILAMGSWLGVFPAALVRLHKVLDREIALVVVESGAAPENLLERGDLVRSCIVRGFTLATDATLIGIAFPANREIGVPSSPRDTGRLTPATA